MRERTDCTRTGGGAPAVAGEWVSIFVGDDHPVLRLKQALDWPALTAEMVSYWQAAGKNVANAYVGWDGYQGVLILAAALKKAKSLTPDGVRALSSST